MHSPPDIQAALAPLFKPRSVAVVGASRTPGKQGNSAFRYLIRGGFPGDIFAVNAAGDGGVIEGYPCYASMRELPGPVDCALVVVPAEAAVEVVRQCSELGVRSVIVASTGFAELGTEEGCARQRELVRLAAAGGVRVVGPNTNGLYNATDHLCLGYNTSFGDPLNPGPVSIAAHSGALFNSIAPRLRQYGAGLSKFVPVGNEADLNLLDFLAYFIEDEATRVIGLIVESLSDGGRFRALAARARNAGKPVVALKLGRSAAGAGATMAHSSRMAGSARAYDALFRECGVATVPSIEALAGACALVSARPQRRDAAGNTKQSEALVCISSTGGGSAMLADFAHGAGIPLAGGTSGEWQGQVARTIAALPGCGPIRNPIDMGSLGKQEQLAELLAAQEADGFVGPAVLFTHLLPNIKRSELIASQMIERKKRIAAPVVVVSPGGLTEDLLARYRSNDIPVFSDIATCFDSLRCFYACATGAEPAEPASAERQPNLDGAGILLRRAVQGRKSFLPETESAEILRSIGVPMVASTEVHTLDEARAAARHAGYPAVLKALPPGVAHKSQLGFVCARIDNAESLEKNFLELERRITAQGYARSQVPVIVQPRLPSEAELIVGVSHERALGHFLIAGLGGIYTEVLDEIVLFPIPVARSTIYAQLSKSRLGRLLGSIGARSAGSDPKSVVTEILDKLQQLILRYGELIESVDINPLLVGEMGCIAVDALVVPRMQTDFKSEEVA